MFVRYIIRTYIRRLVGWYVRRVVRSLGSDGRTVVRSEVSVRTFARSFIHSFTHSLVCSYFAPRSFILFMFSNILLVVKCPMGLYYDTPSKTCKPCPIGFISTQEGSLQCEACPANSSTLEEGSKTCTGNSNLL